MAHSTLLQYRRLMRVNLSEISPLVAFKTSALKDEAAVAIDFMALRTLHAWNRWMLMKRLKARASAGARKELYFLSAALPCQHHRMQSRRNL